MGCRTQTPGQAADGEKGERPANATTTGDVPDTQDGGRPADVQRKEHPLEKGKAGPEPAFQLPLEIKLEAPEVPEAIRRPSPPIPEEADQQRPKKK